MRRRGGGGGGGGGGGDILGFNGRRQNDHSSGTVPRE